MKRVLLINPPSPERLGAPLLGLQYVAASLLRHGHEVRVLDAAASYAAPDEAAILAVVEEFKPDVVGVALFTRWVWHAYRLAGKLRGLGPVLVAGGAHATVCAAETLEQGFDLAIAGEAELTFPRVLAALEGGEDLGAIPGVWFRDNSGGIAHGPCAVAVADLDELAPPWQAQHLFDPRGYSAEGSTRIPGGILTSRGCPAKCTFCANYVTGRSFRYRGAQNVVDELNAWHVQSGATFFPCWDDALTANIPRLLELCAALERDLKFPFSFAAITRANMVTPALLAALKRAGLVHVNFGVESGDDAVLRAIRKGIRTEQVVKALQVARDLELRTACNFMLGFPEETPEAIGRTLGFMERIAPLVDTFSTLGVVVPFPGTPIYDLNHEKYGFTRWWLREEFSHFEPMPPVTDFDRYYRHYIDDRNLELNFFHYTDAHRDAIRAALRYKGEHNLRMMGVLRQPVFDPEPVAAGS
ncbi:MAG TPA: radical SAM protein [Lacunisphaera sp.]|nr:radical SAM protein [Lacunisphaera sp.]